MSNVDRSAAGAPLQLVAPPIVRDDEEWAADPSQASPVGYVREAFRRLLVAAEGADADREGVQATPDRAARAWADLTAGYRTDPASLFTTFESEGYNELVLVKSIPFYSLCEHHLLPFHGVAHVAYVPGERIVGLSKLARLVECFARRLQVQERLTAQIADTMVEHLNPRGVAVVIQAEHLCMAMRGVQKPGSSTVTSAVRGVMFDLPEARAEVLALLRD